MNSILKTTAIDAANDEPALEKAVRTLTDLELMLAAGGDGPVNWAGDPPPPAPGP